VSKEGKLLFSVGAVGMETQKTSIITKLFRKRPYCCDVQVGQFLEKNENERSSEQQNEKKKDDDTKNTRH